MFRYNTDTNKERVVEGRMEYLAMFQPNRIRNRRPPQSMQFVKQEFDMEKFNFNKIDESKELVCQLVNRDRMSRQMERDILIINESPIDHGHCILVPQVEACLPQVSGVVVFVKTVISNTSCPDGPLHHPGPGDDEPVHLPPHQDSIQLPVCQCQCESPTLASSLPRIQVGCADPGSVSCSWHSLS